MCMLTMGYKLYRFIHADIKNKHRQSLFLKHKIADKVIRW